MQLDVVGATCLDLFAGSGALGFEALSRGAKNVMFLDTHKKAVQRIRENCQLLQCNNVEVLHQDAAVFLQSPAFEQFDIVFLDPPFQKDYVEKVAQELSKNHWLHHQALIYVETPIGKENVQLPKYWVQKKDNTAGQVRYQLFQHYSE